MRQHINNNKIIMFILCVTRFSISLLLNLFLKIISDKEYPHFESFFNNILCKYYYQLIYFKFGPRG